MRVSTRRRYGITVRTKQNDKNWCIFNHSSFICLIRIYNSNTIILKQYTVIQEQKSEYRMSQRSYIYFLFSSFRTLSAMTVCTLSSADRAHGVRSDGRWRQDSILSLCSTTGLPKGRRHLPHHHYHSLSLSDHSRFSRKTKTCLFCGCNHSSWSSFHTHWPEISPSAWYCSGTYFAYWWCTALIHEGKNSEEWILLRSSQIWGKWLNVKI